MNRLNENHFSFKCPMSWNELDPVSSDKRFCQQCQKHVYDLTNCSLEEVRELQIKKGKVCGMVRLVSAGSIAASLSLAACNDQETRLMGDISCPTTEQPEQSGGDIYAQPEVMGKIAPPKKDKEGGGENTSNCEKPKPIVGENPIEPEPPMILGDIRVIEEPQLDPNKAS